MKRKEQILKLRAEGKSYNEISKILGCSKGTISFHCGDGQKQKSLLRNNKYKLNKHPYVKKVETFITYKPSSKNKKLNNQYYIYIKIISEKTSMFTKGQIKMFTYKDVINKFGDKPKCYLTGRIIDITKSRSFEFDHILPRSKGGSSTLDNLGITSKEANRAKADLTVPEFIKICEDVLVNFGYKIEKPNKDII